MRMGETDWPETLGHEGDGYRQRVRFRVYCTVTNMTNKVV